MGDTIRSRFLVFVQNLNIYLNSPLKYGLLAAAAILFMISMIILGWQIYKYKTGKGSKAWLQSLGKVPLNCKVDATLLGNWFDTSAHHGKILTESTHLAVKDDVVSKAKKDNSETGPKKQYPETSNLSIRSNSTDFLSVSDEQEHSCIGKHDYKIDKLQEGAEELNYYVQSNTVDKLSLIQKRGNLVTDSMDYVVGKVIFSLSYDDKQSQLHLTVAGASDLPNRTFSQSVDPFIRVKLMSSVQSEKSTHQFIHHRWKTKVARNTRNPSFGEQFHCSIETHVLRKATLKLEVWNVDKYSRRSILGEVRTLFSALNLSDTLKFCEELQKPQKDTIGEILLTLRYLPAAQRLEAGLLKVKSACLVSNPKIGIYTTIDFYVNRHKQKHQKTSTKAKSVTTVFNEVVSFTVGDWDVNHSMILISVYETSLSKDGARHLAGQAYVGRTKSREDDHWLSMLQCLRRPVAKWHPLLI